MGANLGIAGMDRQQRINGDRLRTYRLERAREHGIPMVLGALEATQCIPNGAQAAVDGIAGVVRWFK